MIINISKEYGKNIVFDNLQMEIIESKINVILGPSGCGKTTLLKCIAGLLPYKGEIQMEHPRLSFVFQEDRLFPYLTIKNNLSLITKNEERIDYYLRAFRVKDLVDKYPHELSGGEKQRFSLIRAFCFESNFILMDEPFKSLDFNLRLDVIEVVKELQENTNKTIILVTHDLDTAFYLGHYIHILSNKVTRLLKTFENKFVFQEISENSVQVRREVINLLR